MLDTLNAEPQGCLGELATATELLRREGFRDLPAWEALEAGLRPPKPTITDSGEWAHGWQYYAAFRFEINHRDVAALPNMSPAARAMLRLRGQPRDSGACEKQGSEKSCDS